MDDTSVITIRAIVLGQAVHWIDLASGSTLVGALERAGIEVAGRDVHLNGHPTDLEATLSHDDVITVIPRVRGGGLGHRPPTPGAARTVGLGLVRGPGH